MTTENNLENLFIAGAGAASGGEYRDVRVSGSVKITDSVRCRSVHASGAIAVAGDLHCAGEAVLSGSCKVSGEASFAGLQTSGSLAVGQALSVDSAKISGSFRGGAGFECRENLKISGSANLDGALRCREGFISGVLDAKSLHAGELDVPGILNIEEDVEAERLTCHGVLNIQELLNAERIEIVISDSKGAHSRVGSIGCGSIKVRCEPDKPAFLCKKRPGSLSVETLEGDLVELENTTAEVVRGKTVRIGAGCKIERVEYTDTFERRGESEIESVVKV